MTDPAFAARGAALAACATLAGCSPAAIDVVELAPGALFEGLIAHWTFDDGAGLTVTDSTGHFNGDLPPTAPTATWKMASEGHPGFGGFLHFDGGPQSEVQVPGFFQPNQASWSVAGWVHAPAGDTKDSYATIVSTEIPLVGGWQLNLRLAPPVNPTNAVSLYQYAFSKGMGGTDYIFENCECFVPDTWVHIAGVFDADKQMISLYHDGISAGSTPADQTIIHGSDTLYFGRWEDQTSRRLIGDLDDFVVYNRALTLPEIKQLARAPLPATPPP
jgi:concanavalin A-like lectin/glucanase superfamily protein